MRRLLLVLTAAALSLTTLTGSPAAVAASPARPQTVEWAPAITVATYNICRPTSCAYGRYAWTRRTDALIRTITSANPEILALQETEVKDGSLDLMTQRLAPYGYALADSDTSDCRRLCDAHLFYKTESFEPMGTGPLFAGRVLMADVAPLAPWGGTVEDRPFAYAALRHRESGAPVLALSLHMPANMNAVSRSAMEQSGAVRAAASAGIAAWSTQRAADLGIPNMAILAMGDYNSYLIKNPQGPQYVMAQAGFRNADTASRKVNRYFPTINRTKKDIEWGGFPPKPRRYPRGGPQIDCILGKNVYSFWRWEVFVRTLRNGKFDPAYRGSDHNLVRAILRIPVV